MKNELLSRIDSPADLKNLSDDQLVQLAGEMREALCNVVANRTAHFASNLGVVELALALHLVFDFSNVISLGRFGNLNHKARGQGDSASLPFDDDPNGRRNLLRLVPVKSQILGQVPREHWDRANVRLLAPLITGS